MAPATTLPALSVASTGLRISLLVAATLLSSAALSSAVRADALDVAGHWEGEIEIPGSTLAIKVDLVAPEGADDGWSGTIDIPMQSAEGLPLGDIDRQVDPEQNLPPIAEALFQAETDDVTVMLLPQLNHLFQTAFTGLGNEYGLIEETLAPRVLDLVRDWILERFGPKPAGE